MSATGELLVTAPPEFRVNVAEYRVARECGVITTFGLGSCIAIMLYDIDTRIGGMAHILLPSREMSRRPDQPAKFAETAALRYATELAAGSKASLSLCVFPPSLQQQGAGASAVGGGTSSVPSIVLIGFSPSRS